MRHRQHPAVGQLHLGFQADRAAFPDLLCGRADGHFRNLRFPDHFQADLGRCPIHPHGELRRAGLGRDQPGAPHLGDRPVQTQPRRLPGKVDGIIILVISPQPVFRRLAEKQRPRTADQQARQLPWRRRGINPDPVADRPLRALAHRVNQHGVEFAQRPGDHRRRPAAVKVDGLPDAQAYQHPLELRQRHAAAFLHRDQPHGLSILGMADRRARPLPRSVDTADGAGKRRCPAAVHQQGMAADQHPEIRSLINLAIRSHQLIGHRHPAADRQMLQDEVGRVPVSPQNVSVLRNRRNVQGRIPFRGYRGHNAIHHQRLGGRRIAVLRPRRRGPGGRVHIQGVIMAGRTVRLGHVGGLVDAGQLELRPVLRRNRSPERERVDDGRSADGYAEGVHALQLRRAGSEPSAADFRADRRPFPVGVEDVAVDARRRARVLRHFFHGPPGRDAAAASSHHVQTDVRVGQVDPQHVHGFLHGRPAAGDPGVFHQPYSRRHDRLAPLHQSRFDRRFVPRRRGGRKKQTR